MYSEYCKRIAQSGSPNWLANEIRWMGSFEATLKAYWGNKKFKGWKKGKKRTKDDTKYQRQLQHILEKESAAAEKFTENRLKLLDYIDKTRHELSDLRVNPGDDVDKWNEKLQDLMAKLKSLESWNK